jgi:crotonobetainyl-CoA:carnitine CoA-transferase CaiB-like acyl-CoA transferase
VPGPLRGGESGHAPARGTAHEHMEGASGRAVTRGIVAAMSAPSPSHHPLSLDGIRVIDLSRVIAGPWCGALLADLGADVIKVEDTGPGDESRTWPPHRDGEAAAYLLFNRNKRGITLDLKTPGGVEVVKRLVAGADVLIENFRTGTMESFGLGYDVLAALNPRLIYCSVSAFGRSGPRKDSPGYEALMQAFSGIMSITGEPGRPPVRAGVSFLDLTTGILCALGISNALLQRGRTGLGQRVDASLLETAVSLLAFHAEGYLLTGAVPRALGSGHPSLSPYRNFMCRDGQWIFIAAANDRFWQKLAGSLGRADLGSDPRFAANQQRVAHRAELEGILEETIAQHDRETLLKRLEAADVPATPVNTVDQVMQDPQTAERGIVQRVSHPRLGEIPVVGTPLRFSRMAPGVRRAAPLRGEHTAEVLAECGFSAEEVADLRTRKVVL